jgi:hypothetical protein
VYKYLAIVIRIYGLQNAPKESHRDKNAMDGNLKEAIAHFKRAYPASTPPGLQAVKLLASKFVIGKEEGGLLSKQYSRVAVSLGQWVAGDEKLFHWTGESAFLRLCENKDDYIGFWMYMLAGRLSSGKPFLLHTKLHAAQTKLGESVTCAEVVSAWADVVDKKGIDGHTILVADSYYLDKTGWGALREKEVSFICGVQECRFQELAEKTKKHSKREGDTCLLYNDTTDEMFVTHWYPDKKLGRKFVISNAFTRERGQTLRQYVPGCDDFSLMFNTCDQFNRSLNNRTWPHRCSTSEHQIHNYFLSCMLINTMNAWMNAHNLSDTDCDFEQFAVSLADELYQWACRDE